LCDGPDRRTTLSASARHKPETLVDLNRESVVRQGHARLTRRRTISTPAFAEGDIRSTQGAEESLEKRRLGRTDIRVSRLGLGCATFGREIDELTSGRLMSAALDFDITLFDTAEAYGGGQARQYRRNILGVDDVREVTSEMHSSEKIIGRWLKASGNRSRVLLQTKVTTNFTKQHIQEAIDASLERLQAHWIDLYLFHSFDARRRSQRAWKL
jgi:predicted aldo/keto reductase-like oxidoreductase